MDVVEASTSDRLAEAAQALMDAARAASTEAPGYLPGPNVAEATALAVQALFLADRWHDANHLQQVALPRRETLARIRGLGMGVGCSIGSIQDAVGRGEAVQAFLVCFGDRTMRRAAMREGGAR